MHLGISLRHAIRQGVVMVGAVLVATGMSGAALADPSTPPSASPPADVRVAQLTGDSIAEPISVSTADHARIYGVLAQEVEWLANRPVGNAGAPAEGKAGPRITLTLSLNGTPQQTYDLYPLAAGGPRVYRPAAQPDQRKVAEAWFLGRLSMPAALHAAGAPVGDAPQVGTGGGGGSGVQASPDPGADLQALLGDWQRFVGLNGAVVVLIAAGVFGIAYLIRRRV
jgi:hypothetical protein